MPTAVTTHPRRDTFRIPKHKRHVPQARAQIRRILKDWALDAELAHDIATVATELVTNSVRHCRVALAQVEVTLSIRGCGLLVEVSDPDRERIPTLPAGVDEEAAGGRGLLLVAGLASRWGHDLRPFTKCVWAYFLIPEESRCSDY
ncbi:ATP-binding protein [Streptomyces dysideae]|uniref:Serine/threonine protein phosphatase n=1 Tax=Streptomyces dysideae TaxID=909626 RepID=A0A101V2E7_9ACTN|nr:ATP-binding protein [Streptomyces dysideae]KUO21279.1 serine/threonine protein phosphatase [Streptomyces dysideae]